MRLNYNNYSHSKQQDLDVVCWCWFWMFLGTDISAEKCVILAKRWVIIIMNMTKRLAFTRFLLPAIQRIYEGVCSKKYFFFKLFWVKVCIEFYFKLGYILCVHFFVNKKQKIILFPTENFNLKVRLVNFFIWNLWLRCVHFIWKYNGK